MTTEMGQRRGGVLPALSGLVLPEAVVTLNNEEPQKARYKLLATSNARQDAVASEFFFGRRYRIRPQWQPVGPIFLGDFARQHFHLIFRRYTRRPGVPGFHPAATDDVLIVYGFWVLRDDDYLACAVHVATSDIAWTRLTGSSWLWLDLLDQGFSIFGSNRHKQLVDFLWQQVQEARSSHGNVTSDRENTSVRVISKWDDVLDSLNVSLYELTEEHAEPAKHEALPAPYGPSLSADLVEAGFDATHFNVAIVGTNNTGKSALANLLLIGNPDDSQPFVEACERLSALNGQTMERVKGLRPFKVGTGRCTTDEMLRNGECRRDASVWFPGAVVWDMPGLELSHGGVDQYFKHMSLNHFDAVLIVCEKQLSMDDFLIMSYLQCAVIDGDFRENGVPFWIVRTKMDDVFKDNFSQISSGGQLPPHRWKLEWASLTRKTREEMLPGLERANERLAGVDPLIAMTESVSFPLSRFIFSGFARALADHAWKGASVPLVEAHKLHNMFEGELRRLRQALHGLASERVRECSSCGFSSLMSAMARMPSSLPPLEPRSEVQCSVQTPELGFRVERRVILPPKRRDGADLRQQHGIEEADLLLEFPLGTTFVDGMDIMECARELPRPLEILVSREVEEVERSFHGSNYRKHWVTCWDPTLEQYDSAVRGLISECTREAEDGVSHMMETLRKCRPASAVNAAVEVVAGCDWTCPADLEWQGYRHGGLFAMVAAAVRDDAEPAVAHAATFMLALRPSIVRRLRRKPTEPAIVVDCGFPRSGRTHRGTSMPEHELQKFFTPEKNYRAVWPLATSASESVALDFMRASHHRNQSHTPVHFVVDVSEEPLHVNFIQHCVEDEFEFLFIPYSCFKVVQVLRMGSHHEVHIKAHHDNMPAAQGEAWDSEHWPVAPWH